MPAPLVMTLIGPDRTGLVEAVARVIAGHGGNWLESRLCRLGGEFAGIVRVEIPEPQKSALLAALQALPALQVVVRADTAAARPPAARARWLALAILGSDRPGIVQEISGALARARVNVEEFSSELQSAPMSGELLFKASARLQLPPDCELAALRQDLEKIAADLLVDLAFTDLAGQPIPAARTAPAQPAATPPAANPA